MRSNYFCTSLLLPCMTMHAVTKQWKECIRVAITLRLAVKTHFGLLWRKAFHVQASRWKKCPNSKSPTLFLASITSHKIIQKSPSSWRTSFEYRCNGRYYHYIKPEHIVIAYQTGYINLIYILNLYFAYIYHILHIYIIYTHDKPTLRIIMEVKSRFAQGNLKLYLCCSCATNPG